VQEPEIRELRFRYTSSSHDLDQAPGPLDVARIVVFIHLLGKRILPSGGPMRSSARYPSSQVSSMQLRIVCRLITSAMTYSFEQSRFLQVRSPKQWCESGLKEDHRVAPKASSVASNAKEEPTWWSLMECNFLNCCARPGGWSRRLPSRPCCRWSRKPAPTRTGTRPWPIRRWPIPILN